MKRKKTKAGKRFCVLLLSLLLVMQGVFVFAETGEETQEVYPANPVHHCLGGGPLETSDWSYIYFGSYPQREVTEDALTPAIIEAEYDEYGDAWVNGSKYRRITKEETNDRRNFGSVEYRYFKWERIKWRVLQNDGSTMFIMSDAALDCKKYDSDPYMFVWEKCSVRSWLNNDFYNMAFENKEQEAIREPDAANGDKICFLSLEDVVNPLYGFCDLHDVHGEEIVYQVSGSRLVKTSDYAYRMGVKRGDLIGEGEHCSWWVRDMGENPQYATAWSDGDLVNNNMWTTFNTTIGCVPALYIELSSELWEIADENTQEKPADTEQESENTQEKPADTEQESENAQEKPTDTEQPENTEKKTMNPLHHCTKKIDGTDLTDWCYVYFGSYPQTEVVGADLTSEIINAAYDENKDAWVKGTKYRRVQKEDANHGDYFGDKKYRYFKWERIKWRVLQDDGDTLLLMADQGLDCKNYNEEYVSVTWEESSLFSWLKMQFYENAFNKAEQDAMEEQVRVLFADEAKNPSYGFCEDGKLNSVSRFMQASDYAKAMGVYVYSDCYTEENENCFWWLGTKGADKHEAVVHNYGYVNEVGEFVDKNNLACVPVLSLKHDSDLWLIKDDGTSGMGGDEEIPKDPGEIGSEQDTEHGTEQDTEQNTEQGTEKGTESNSENPTENKGTENPIQTVEGNSENQGTQEVRVRSIAIQIPSKKLAAGKKIKLAAKIKPTNASNSEVEWKSNSKYAKIKNGVLTLSKKGAGKKVKITAVAKDGSQKRSSCQITIMRDAVKSIKVSAQRKSIKAGASMKLKAAVKATGKKANKSLMWISSNTKYATVSTSGKVKAKKAGQGKKVTILVKTTDGTNKKAKIRITIK